jgi:hypothetical protein
MGLRTRLAVVLAIAGVAAVAAVRIDQGAQAKPGALTWRCGVERWKVKTLQDQPELVYRGTKSIAWLVRRKKPQPLPPTRAPLEFNIYRVVAAVTHVIPQNAQDGDGDLHLVLDDGAGETMIAEARADVRLCEKAELIGVAFFDFDHGQTGLADNEIELHPILKFRCLG